MRTRLQLEVTVLVKTHYRNIYMFAKHLRHFFKSLYFFMFYKHYFMIRLDYRPTNNFFFFFPNYVWFYQE